MTTKTPATTLPLPIKVWTDHILPYLPLDTILNVTTLLNKETSSVFDMYEDDLWLNYLKKQHIYLVGLRRACEYYYPSVKGISWSTYAKGCFSREYPQENYAMMVGNCHAILCGSRYDLIPQALTRLKQLRDELKSVDFQISYYETWLLKTNDVFNNFAVFLDMFDPAFSALYTDSMTILHEVTQDLKTKIENNSNPSWSPLTNCVNEVSLFLRSMKQTIPLLPPLDSLIGVLRLICLPGSQKNNGDILFIIFRELMQRLGYAIDSNQVAFKSNGEFLTYWFRFNSTKHSFYSLDFYEDGDVVWDEQESEQGWKFEDFELFIKERQSSNQSSTLLLRYSWGHNFMDEMTVNSHYDYIINNNRDLIFFLRCRYGMNMLPGMFYDTTLLKSINWNSDICPAHGCFAWSSKNMVVILGFNTVEQKYYCLNMVSKLFLESPINLVIVDKLCDPFKDSLEQAAEPIEVLHGIFKYNTQIGQFFKSYENNRFTDFLL
ncbi:hypothetical protein ACO0QE_000130 [Hanseniaspora vineae]